MTVKTQNAIIIDGKVYKPSQFTEKNNYTISYIKKGTECSICGEGVRFTIEYDPAAKQFNTSEEGTDYSKKCHHHNTFAIFGCNGDHHYETADAKKKCRWFLGSGEKKDDPNNAREINPKTGAVIGTQTFGNHSDNFPKADISELSSMTFEQLVKKYPNPAGDGKNIECQGDLMLKGYKFCKDCKKILP